MVASPNILKQSGAQSATFYVPTVNAGESGFINGTLTIADWETLPAGQLKTLLTTKYLGSADPLVAPIAEFFDAYGVKGGVTNCFGLYGDPATNFESVGPIHWQLDSEGYPTLTDMNASVIPMMFRIQTRYSASE